ncbi:putative eukaryotic elongation factor 2 kinase (Eef-2 kinase) [Fasciolopsis buskii]|uniref:Putative eukaryotic elongation factor 2 kinase (Eef-2 kinase) n=1 Tax=Fasciolopsis buskii TaxID=27845 RepID=A0A8E0S8V0_9TREM|nr:putative eukaryotic elongation factor 2 kinase (Eef-2 kinase) [Fasciolopsis buski]
MIVMAHYYFGLPTRPMLNRPVKPNQTDLRSGVGRYDAAEDLLPVYRIPARMAEMYSIGSFGLKQDLSVASNLFKQAGKLASAARQGRLADKYFEFGEEAYSSCD